MVFLCWNLNNRPLQHLVSALVRSRRVDILILLECSIPTGELLQALAEATNEHFQYADSPAKQPAIRVFVRFPRRFLIPVEDGPRYSIRRLSLPAKEELLLVLVHLPSKLFWDDDSQAQECSVLARTIEEVETRLGHFRTMIVGDLNMNPFEKGVVGAAGLNATMVRRRALKESRTVQQRTYRYFFNPMWRLFGDGDDSAPGTYHYDSHAHVAYFWNIFDQVLVRPSLESKLAKQSIEIVDTIEGVSLLTEDGVPNTRVGSDHLPLIFEMRL